MIVHVSLRQVVSPPIPTLQASSNRVHCHRLRNLKNSEEPCDSSFLLARVKVAGMIGILHGVYGGKFSAP